MPLNETLTVLIDADSSVLEAELDRVAGRVDGLAATFQRLTSLGPSVARAVSGVSRAVGPLTRLSSTIGSVQQQLNALSSTTVNVNVQPALQSLTQLMQQAFATAAALRAVSGGAITPSAPTVSEAAGGPRGPAPPGGAAAFATGGLVTGNGGEDRVPAVLTAGEFVLRPETVRRFDRPMLDRLNAHGPAALMTTPPPDTTFDVETSPVRPNGLRQSDDRFQRAAPAAVLSNSPRPPTRSVASETPASVFIPTPSPDTAAVRDSAPTESHPVAASALPVASPPPVQHFGDIVVNVTQPMELGDVLSQLELARLSDRSRFG